MRRRVGGCLSATDEKITRLLEDAQRGNASAEATLYTTVYAELRRIAKRQRGRWSGNDTMSTTVLVNEAYLKLAGANSIEFTNRAHFFATAARAMRQVLLNYAERMQAVKRGGDMHQVTFSDALAIGESRVDDVLAVERVVQALEARNERYGRVLECRLFGGMSVAETAAALDVSDRTVKRDWAFVSAWLHRELGGDQ